MIAIFDGTPDEDQNAPRGGVLDQLDPSFTVHIVERYWWRWEDEPNSDPQYLGQKRLGTYLRVPFPYDVTVRQIRIYMVTVTETGVVNTSQIKNGTQVVYPTAPTFTSAAFDNVGNDVDMVFHKNSTGTGAIQVEYKKPIETNWTTHATTFAHGATSGSIAITQESTSQTYQIRLKQVGVQNYSRTIEVTILGLSGGNAPPTFTSVAYDSANSEVDMVFVKNGSGTGNIEVEYKLASDSTWITHATTFAHGATSGSIVVIEAGSALTYDIRLKQASVTGYSTTRQVTVDAAPGGAPTNLVIDLAVESPPGSCEWVVDLTWDAGSGSDNYTIEQKIASGSWTTVNTNSLGLTQAVGATGSFVGRTWYWRVKQNDVAGYTNQVSYFIEACEL